MSLITELDDRHPDEPHSIDRDLYEPSPSAGTATVRRVYGLPPEGGRGR